MFARAVERGVARKSQPVIAVAAAPAKSLQIALWTGCVTKTKRTAELKDVVECDKRMEALKEAFAVSREQSEGKSILLFDDFCRSGATVGAITELLRKTGKVKAVGLLTQGHFRRIC